MQQSLLGDWSFFLVKFRKKQFIISPISHGELFFICELNSELGIQVTV